MKIFVRLVVFLCLIPLHLFAQKATVKSIYDGDTFRVTINGTEEKIRLIGIDTPELRDNKRAQKQTELYGTDTETILRYGASAKRFVESVLHTGDVVKLEADIQLRDKYKRLLAYVYLPDGRMLNDLIVSEGFGSIATFPPNVKYQERFLESQQSARAKEKGLWKKTHKQ